MDYFNYQNGQLYAESVPVESIATQYGTPCYIYSQATLIRHWQAFDQALNEQNHLICYAVKANSNLAVLDRLNRLGSGFDIVSIGELERVLRVGADPKRIVFSGVGKRRDEMERALEVGIGCFNIESEPELERLAQIAQQIGRIAPIALRVNPDVDAGTHPYISTGLKKNKFGIPIEQAFALYQKAAQIPSLHIVGVDYHIGSQLTELSPFLDALDRVLILIDQLQQYGIKIEHLDVGGGLGVPYQNEQPPSPAEYAHALQNRLKGRSLALYLEPGRAIAANAGILLTRVEYIKNNGHKQFAIVDAAMNDLIRPSLYQSWQSIIEVKPQDGPAEYYDVVGPICETGDFIGKDRALRIQPGDLLAVRSAGAYGFVMASNYNSRPRPAEIMVEGDRVHLIRARESLSDLWRGEKIQ